MKRASAPGYDQFKSIVTAVLVVILILMLLRGCATNPASPVPVENTVIPNATEVSISSPTSTETLPASSPADTVTPSPLPPTIEPTATAPTVDLTATSAPTETPTAVPPAVTATQPQNTSCNTSVPSRLNVGQKAQVLRRLNMRSEASINATIIQTNATNTQVDIIGGPVCTPVGARAYLWWQIRLANGAEGWSAESPLNEASYFLEPIP